jgi:transcriptional regulator with PAS, ATPase and Fis domain
MAARKHITIAALKAALKAHAGVYVLAADELGVTRQTVRQRVERSPALEA